MSAPNFTSFKLKASSLTLFLLLLSFNGNNKTFTVVDAIINSADEAASEISKLTSINTTLYNVQNVNQSVVVPSDDDDPFTLTLDGIRNLEELPLEKLLLIKKQLEELTGTDNNNNNNNNEQAQLPQSAAMTAESKFDISHVEQGGFMPMRVAADGVMPYDPDKKLEVYDEGGFITPQPFINDIKKTASHEAWDSKPSKIQTVFQVSVTALSFLAFAGYLLCMIVQAIKSKGELRELLRFITPHGVVLCCVSPKTNFSPSHVRIRSSATIIDNKRLVVVAVGLGRLPIIFLVHIWLVE